MSTVSACPLWYPGMSVYKCTSFRCSVLFTLVNSYSNWSKQIFHKMNSSKMSCHVSKVAILSLWPTRSQEFNLSHPRLSLGVYLTVRPFWGEGTQVWWGWGWRGQDWTLPVPGWGWVSAAGIRELQWRRLGPVVSRACSAETCRTRGGGSPSLCAGRRSRSSEPHYIHCTFHWPYVHSSSNSVKQC